MQIELLIVFFSDWTVYSPVIEGVYYKHHWEDINAHEMFGRMNKKYGVFYLEYLLKNWAYGVDCIASMNKQVLEDVIFTSAKHELLLHACNAEHVKSTLFNCRFLLEAYGEKIKDSSVRSFVKWI